MIAQLLRNFCETFVSAGVLETSHLWKHVKTNLTSICGSEKSLTSISAQTETSHINSWTLKPHIQTLFLSVLSRTVSSYVMYTAEYTDVQCTSRTCHTTFGNFPISPPKFLQNFCLSSTHRNFWKNFRESLAGAKLLRREIFTILCLKAPKQLLHYLGALPSETQRLFQIRWVFE